MENRLSPIKFVPIGTISPDPANVRCHSPENIAAIKASLRRFGQQKPIIVDARGVIRAGNGTYQAARELGWRHIAVVTTNLTGADAAAFAIADNRTAELATWDPAALQRQFAALDEMQQLASGFSADSIQSLLHAIPDSPELPEPDIKPLAEIPRIYELTVECRDPQDQQTLYEQLAAQGRKVRVLTL